MVGSWGDGDVGGEGIFLLAGTAREMSVLRLCRVTLKEAVVEYSPSLVRMIDRVSARVELGSHQTGECRQRVGAGRYRQRE